jgi:ketosteroid isomerase-like protein
MSSSYQLATEPEGIVASLLAHINSLDEDVMLGFYEPGAMLVSATGVPQRGAEAMRAELGKYFSLGLPMKITARHIFVANDIASLVLDWSISGISRSGVAVNMVATANDIARRGADGRWRYLIDNPFGTALRQEM